MRRRIEIPERAGKLSVRHFTITKNISKLKTNLLQGSVEWPLKVLPKVGKVRAISKHNFNYSIVSYYCFNAHKIHTDNYNQDFIFTIIINHLDNVFLYGNVAGNNY